MAIMKTASAGYSTVGNPKVACLQGKRRVRMLRSAHSVSYLCLALLLFVLLSKSFAVSPVFATEPLVVGMSMWGGERTSLPEIECLLSEAYSRIGVDVEFKYTPDLRMKRALTKGEIDATGAMLSTFAEGLNNVVKVPALLGNIDIYAVSTDKNMVINSVEDLNNYKVACLRGSSEKFASILGCDNWFYEVSDLTQAFKMMDKGRVDVVLADQYTGRMGADLNGVDHIYFSSSLFSSPAYHYLNSKHSDLAPRLAQVFRDMFKDGSAKQCYGKYSHAIPEKYNEQ